MASTFTPTVLTSGGSGGSGSSTAINQTAHGFVVGDWVYLNGSAYAKARADSVNTASVVGIVSAAPDVNNFTLTTSGLVTGLAGLTVGADYFLSPTTAGAMTATEPTTVGHVSAPVGIAASATSIQVAIKRSVVIGTSNVFTTINLANTSPTTIQNISSFANGEGGVLTGVIKVDATTDYVFGFEISFTKDIAGVINHSVRYFAGDVLPTISVTVSGQNIQVTLGTLAGFVSASARFQMAASAVSPSLQIGAANVTGSTTGTAPGAGLIGERISATITTTALTTSEADVTGASLALTPGVWEIKYSVTMAISTGTTIDAVTNGSAVITNSSNTEIGSSYRTHSGRTIVAGKAFASRGCLAASEVVNITANTTYKLRCSKNDDVVVGSASLDNSSTSKSTFYAIRIA